jgi:hypothetical protein
VASASGAHHIREKIFKRGLRLSGSLKASRLAAEVYIVSPAGVIPAGEKLHLDSILHPSSESDGLGEIQFGNSVPLDSWAICLARTKFFQPLSLVRLSLQFVELVAHRNIVSKFTMSEKPNGSIRNHGYPWRLIRSEFLDQLFAFQIKLR